MIVFLDINIISFLIFEVLVQKIRLTHWGQYKITTILQLRFSITFSWLKNHERISLALMFSFIFIAVQGICLAWHYLLLCHTGTQLFSQWYLPLTALWPAHFSKDFISWRTLFVHYYGCNLTPCVRHGTYSMLQCSPIYGIGKDYLCLFYCQVVHN